MTQTSHSVLALLIVACLNVQIPAQDAPKISIGLVSLSIGDAQDTVLARLAEYYDLRKSPLGDGPVLSWLVWTKGPAERTSVANVSFRDGKLQGARRYWGPANQAQGVPLSMAVFGVISEFVKEGRQRCSIGVGSNQAPDAEIKTIFVVCSGKSLEIGITRSSRHGDAATVDEVLELPR